MKMNKNEAEILQWLIDGFDLSRKADLFDKKQDKEIPIWIDLIALDELAKIEFNGRKLLEINGYSIHFYPLAIYNYLEKCKEK